MRISNCKQCGQEIKNTHRYGRTKHWCSRGCFNASRRKPPGPRAPHPRKGNGRWYAWIVAHKDYADNDCLIYPGFRDPVDGRGRLGYNGIIHQAHRLMCELVHGPGPDGYHARHLCGMGHTGCVSPRHLAWGSPSENNKDRRKHGTHRTNKHGSRTPLTPEQIRIIRASKGKVSQRELAKRFGVSEPNIRRWQTTTHEPAPPGRKRQLGMCG